MTERILVAFDESPQATGALRRTLERSPEAEIHVLHVTDPREWMGSDGMGSGYYSEAAFERARESAEALLEEAERIAGEYDTTVTTATREGRAASAVVEYAEEHDVDHVVLGSHGRTGLSRFLLGSVAETVARRSPVSVTIVRETGRADDQEDDRGDDPETDGRAGRSSAGED
ncbi:MAG: universal stress protein [Haloarculaceae archaeon]